MASYPSLALRLWRTQPWSRNPLMRWGDRLERSVRILAVLVMLIGVPVAAAAGTADYTSTADRIRSDNAVKVSVTATLTPDPATDAGPGTAPILNQVPVRWATANGQTGQATIKMPDTAVRDGRVQIWLGPDGRPTGDPQPSGAAALHGIGAAFTMFVEVCFAATAFATGAGWVLAARRSAAWAREWRAISRPIGHEKQ